MKKIYPKLKPKKTKWDGDRIVGCQSTNHVTCKGELWECQRCRKKICWEEGLADDLVDLCDDCWYDVRVLGNEYLSPLEHWKQMYPGMRHFDENQAKD